MKVTPGSEYSSCSRPRLTHGGSAERDAALLRLEGDQLLHVADGERGKRRRRLEAARLQVGKVAELVGDRGLDLGRCHGQVSGAAGEGGVDDLDECLQI